MKRISIALTMLFALGAKAATVDFMVNGVPKAARIDTVTPANTLAIPSALYDTTGVQVSPANSGNQVTANGFLSSIDVNIASIDAKLASLGQKTMAGSMPVVISSDQSAIPVTGPLTDVELRAAAVLVTQASQPLPFGAATEATLATLSTEATLLNVYSAASLSAQAINVDTSAPGINALMVGGQNAAKTQFNALQVSNAGHIIADVASMPISYAAGNTDASTQRVVIATDQAAIPVTMSPGVNTGSFDQITNLVATAQTFTAPANAIGFKIQAPSTNTENIAFSVGSVATITAGILMEPGRSEDFDTGSNISVIATSATPQTVTVIWKIKP